MAYQRSPLVTMLLQQRMQEKLMDRELKEYFTKQAYQNEQNKTFQMQQDARTFFQLGTELYQNAQTPAQKEAIVNRMKQGRGIFEQYSPILAKAMDSLLAGTPLEQQEIRKRDWLKTNPEIKPPAFKPNDNPQLYAQQAWSHELWKRAYHKSVNGEDYIMPLHISLGDNQVSFMDQNGKVEVTSWELYNQHLDELGQPFGVNGQYLIHSGGWTPWHDYSYEIMQDGAPRRVLLRMQDNVLSGETRKKIIDIGRGKGKDLGAGGVGGAGSMKDLMAPPADSIIEAMLAISRNTDKHLKGPESKMVYDQATDIMKKYDSDPERAEAELNRLLSSVDPRFTYVVTGRDDEAKYTTSLFGTKLKFGEGAYLRAIPGQMVTTATIDGVELLNIVDDRNNAVYNSRGAYLGPISVLDQIQNSTSKDLGVTLPPPPPATPVPMTATEQEKADMQDELKVLDQELKMLESPANASDAFWAKPTGPSAATRMKAGGGMTGRLPIQMTPNEQTGTNTVISRMQQQLMLMKRKRELQQALIHKNLND